MLSRRAFLGVIPLGAMLARLRGESLPSSHTAADVAKFGYELFRQGNFAEVVERLDEESLQRFHSFWKDLLRTADEDACDHWLELIGVESLPKFKVLSPTQLLNGILENISKSAALFADYEFSFLGVVQEGAETSHVVYELVNPAGDRLPPRLVSLQRAAGTWSLLMGGEFSLKSRGMPPEDRMTKTFKLRVRVIGRFRPNEDKEIVVYEYEAETEWVKTLKISVSPVTRRDGKYWNACAGTDEQLAAFLEQTASASILEYLPGTSREKWR